MLSQHTIEFIDSWLLYRSAWNNSPGMSVAIAHSGELLLQSSYGLADVDSKKPMSPAHVFQIASHSKTFTAIAVLSLQEKGLLRIDDTLNAYLPWLASHSDTRWSDVTIRQLLAHSAGIMRDGDEADFWQLSTPFPDDIALQQVVLQSKLAVEPNTKMKYSNLGFALLGRIIAEVTNSSYEQYVQDMIIAPLQLNHTYTDVPADDANDSIAIGYSRQFAKESRMAVPSVSANALRPATGLWSTPKDLCTLYSALMPGSGKLLRDASKREMQRLQWGSRFEGNGYGLGLQLNKYDVYETYGHTGGYHGYSTKTVTDQSSGLTVSVMMNSCDGEATNTIENIFAAIAALGDHKPTAEQASFEGRFASLGGCIEVMSSKKGLMQIIPGMHLPFFESEQMEVVDANTLISSEASVFANRGEQFIYHRSDDGSVRYIVRGGITMYPTESGDVREFLKIKV